MHTQPLKQLRQQLRQSRQQLAPATRAKAEQRIVRRVCHLPWVRQARCLALYWPNDGEPNVSKLITQLDSQFCLPKISCYRRKQMQWRLLTPGTPLIDNRYGIPEPFASAQQRPDVILLPLVGFDDLGRRLGMGGGYYDRALQQRLRHPHVRLPKLIGIAFDCQRCPSLPERAWDVPMDALITESRLWRFR